MPTNSKTTPAAQPTPNSGDQPIDPQPAAASVQPAEQMDESTADNGTQAEASPNAGQVEDESKAESQLSEEEVVVGKVEEGGQENEDDMERPPRIDLPSLDLDRSCGW